MADFGCHVLLLAAVKALKTSYVGETFRETLAPSIIPGWDWWRVRRLDVLQLRPVAEPRRGAARAQGAVPCEAPCARQDDRRARALLLPGSAGRRKASGEGRALASEGRTGAFHRLGGTSQVDGRHGHRHAGAGHQPVLVQAGRGPRPAGLQGAKREARRALRTRSAIRSTRRLPCST
jgi:hypothetical protein